MEMIALADLVGLDDPLDPASMRFTVKVAKSCRSCLFNGQRASVCFLATAIAQRSDLPDCDAGFAYVPITIDERQLSIE